MLKKCLGGTQKALGYLKQADPRGDAGDDAWAGKQAA